MRICVAVLLLIAPAIAAQDLPDIRSVEPDLVIPPLTRGAPTPGKRVPQTTPGFDSTEAYHVLYLPTDWQPDKKYPVIFEWAGNGNYRNAYGDVSTGVVEDSKLGFGISAGKGFIWVCIPFLDRTGTKNVITWWGAPATPTVDYCKKTAAHICAKWGGDDKRLVLAGFSRGAIACNALGLYDDDIAKLWKAMIPFSHYHGVNERWPFPGADRATALKQLERLRCPQFICGESAGVLAETEKVLKTNKVAGDFTFQHIGFRNHNDAWILRPSATREKLRTWLDKALR